MQKILENLYKGRIFPAEQPFIRDDEYRQAYKQECDLEEELLSQLNDRQKELWESMCDSRVHRAHIGSMYAFVDAFRLGAGIAIEVLCGQDEA